MYKDYYEDIAALEKQAKKEPVCIVLDWLNLYYTQTEHFPVKIHEDVSFKITDDCYLLAVDKPTLHFNSQLQLIYHGEVCAHLLLNSKSEKFFKKDVVKVEIKNHALYSGVWIEVLEILENFGLRYKAAGRIDIAIDGLNSMHNMMNIYAKQGKVETCLVLKNCSTTRARFSAKIKDPVTSDYENLTVGSTGGTKMITIYNKSLEIVKSGKKYIQEYWLRNGVIQEMQDLEKQAAEVKRIEKGGYEAFNLKGCKNIYRFEIRLKSECIKEIKDFSIENLKTASGLASIVKLHCKRFFELTLNDNSKADRCTPVDIIPFKRLRAVPLKKISRVENDGVYRAKLSIHGAVQDIYRAKIHPDKVKYYIEHVFDLMERYKLSFYVDKKMEEWGRRYGPATPQAELAAVSKNIGMIHGRLNAYTSEYADMAERHGQAGATAAFGE